MVGKTGTPGIEIPHGLSNFSKCQWASKPNQTEQNSCKIKKREYRYCITARNPHDWDRT